LNLSGNEFDKKPESIKHLCEALKSNISITSLGLYINDLKEDSVQSLYELLKTNSTIASVELLYDYTDINSSMKEFKSKIKLPF